MAYRLNPPPGWPPVPDGFVPPPGWQPDPAWPAAPPGWQLWVPDETEAGGGTLPAAPPLTPGVHYYTADSPARGTNGFAIASFVLGLLGGALLSVIFGIVALNKLRDRPQGGKGFAIAGLCLSGAWVVGIVAVFVVVSATAAQRSATGQITRGGHVDVISLRAGDCFQNPSGSQPDQGVLTRVTAVPCATPHNAQVIALVPVPGSAYPGAAVFHAQALTGCKASLETAVDRSKLTATMGLFWLYPQQQAWADGQRTISCVIADSSQDLTSSLLK